MSDNNGRSHGNILPAIYYWQKVVTATNRPVRSNRRVGRVTNLPTSRLLNHSPYPVSYGADSHMRDPSPQPPLFLVPPLTRPSASITDAGADESRVRLINAVTRE